VTVPKTPDRFWPVATVARHELGRQWRNRAFWSSALFTALLIGALLVIPALVGGDRDQSPEIGVVGQRPQLTAALAAHAEVSHYPDAGAATAAVRDSEVAAALLPDGRVVVDRTLPGDLARMIQLGYLATGTGPAGRDVAVPPLRVTALEPDSARLQQRTLTAGVGVLVLALLLMLSGSATAQNVAEEKRSRIVELLLAKVRAWQLLAGKILGMSAAALSQLLAIMAVGYAVAVALGVLVAPAEALVVLGTLLLWFVPTFVLFTTGYAVAGALVSGPEDTGHVTGPVTCVQVLCLTGPLLVVSGADQLLTTVVSLVPGFSWATMPVRMAYGDVPGWQIGVAYALMLLPIYPLVRLGGRLYRGGLIQHQGRIRVADALRGAAVRNESLQGK
jgi:ABC-2 type transport system permease protein